MKRLFVLMSCAVLLSACATRNKPMAQWVPPTVKAKAPVLTDANGNPIENIPFRAGVSSVTVEKMAQAQGCASSQGAGLLTPQGPVEVYRVVCESRQVFMARCELRQCRPMAAMPTGGYAALPVPAPSNVYVATIPADSNVSVATVPSGTATYAVAAPAALPPQVASRGALGARQVPSLAIDWQCGGCAQNEKVAPLIMAGYKMEAAKEGYTVSEAETATVSIVDYRQRPIGMRIAFGFMAGRDRLGTKIGFRGQTLQAASSTAMAVKGMNAVSEEVGRRAFTQLRTTTN